MPDARLTCLDFWIKAGSIFEKTGEEGLAHFLEHMIFKGGNDLKEGDFDRKIEALGGSSNAATGLDDVHFHVLIPPEAVEKALGLLINLVLTPTFDPKAFEIEKEVVLEEISQHNDVPEEQIFQELLKMCWGNHPYGKSILGQKSTLEKINPKKMRLFHERLYKGENCVISIAGKIPTNIKEIIEESMLSKLKTSSSEIKENRNYSTLLFRKGRKKIKVKRLESSRITMAWPIAAAKDQLLVMGADIATSLLSEGRRSRLVQHLRENLQIVESIEMDITILEEGGLILLEACCLENQLELVQEEIKKVILDLINTPPNKQEVKRAYQLVRNSLCFSLELSSNVASLAGYQTLWGRQQSLLRTLKYLEYWTEEKLQNEIFTTLHPNKSATLISTPLSNS